MRVESHHLRDSYLAQWWDVGVWFLLCAVVAAATVVALWKIRAYI